VIDPTEHLLVVLLTNKKHSPIVPNGSQGYLFSGDSFETGRYGTILCLIFEALQK
jgi:N-acetylmuramoyl-L-alanine amidase